MKQKVRRTVSGVDVRRWIPVLIEARIVVVEAEIDIETTIVVVVGECSVGECTLRRSREIEGMFFELEFIGAIVCKQQRATAGHDKQVLVPPVLEVCKQCAGSCIENVESGALSHVFKCSIAAIPVQAVGQPGRLTDIHVVETVAVEIPHCDSLVAVHVYSRSPVQHSAPVIGAAQELVLVGSKLSKCLGGDVHEKRTLGPADCLIVPSPLHHAPTRCGIFKPFCFPGADPLFPRATRVLANKCVADIRRDSDRGHAGLPDRSDLKRGSLQH